MINCFRKNKKGTVLFTVIVVMMVLIITMMSTMVVVITAQKKSITNFTDSQSYVTAKSVLDIFVEGLTDMSSTDYAPVREALIGKFVPGTGGAPDKMVGGLDYVDDGFAADRDLTDVPKTDYVRDYIVGATMKETGTGDKILGMGEIVGNRIVIRRLDRLTFKLTITVLDGTEYETVDIDPDGDGVTETVTRLKRTQNSSKTVSRLIKLSAGPSVSVFDSSLISCSGETELNAKSQLYGGYVSAADIASSTELNGNANYIGRIFSKGTLFNNDGSTVHVDLSTRKYDTTDSAGSPVTHYYYDYIESETKIDLQKLEARNIIPSGEPAALRKPDGINNPYIFASGGTTSEVIIGHPGSGLSTVGSSATGDRIDIYSKGNVTLDNVEIYGDIYAVGDVELNGSSKVHGNIYCGGTADTSGGTLMDGGMVKPLTASHKFPDGYAINTYMDVDELMDQEYVKNGEKYNKSGGPAKATIQDCFDHPVAPSSHPSEGTIQTYTLTNGMVIDPENDRISAAIDPQMPYMMVPTIKKGSNVIARGANLSVAGFSGEAKILLGEEDLFFNIVDIGSGGWTPYFGGTATIVIQPDGTLSNPSDYGNVYFYSDMGTGSLMKNYEIFTNFGTASTTYDDGVAKQYGTKPLVETALSEPSHFFWLMDGSSMLNYEGSTFVHGYIYAKNIKMGGTSYSAPNQGKTVSFTASYDDKAMPMGTATGDALVPAYIGSCISSSNGIKGGVSSIFVPPPRDNIFDGAVKISLDKYAWNTGMYNNR